MSATTRRLKRLQKEAAAQDKRIEAATKAEQARRDRYERSRWACSAR